MPQHLTVLSHLFPRDGVQLGRLVANIAAPHDNYYPPTRIRYLKGDIYNLTNNDLLDKRSKNTNSTLSVVVDSILSALFHRKSDIDTKIADTVCITYFLDNSEAKFTKICQTDAAKRWFETTYRKRKQAYMVTGIQTITDASLWFQQNKGSGGEIKADVNLAAAAGGAPAPLPAGKVKLMASHLTGKHVESGFVAENEQIYAILYRKIKLGVIDKLRDPTIDTLEKATLENGGRWEVMWKTMSGEPPSSTVLEAVLEDQTHIELQPGLESCEIGGETVVFVPVVEPGKA